MKANKLLQRGDVRCKSLQPPVCPTLEVLPKGSRAVPNEAVRADADIASNWVVPRIWLTDSSRQITAGIFL